jgi:hypothetical protein
VVSPGIGHEIAISLLLHMTNRRLFATVCSIALLFAVYICVGIVCYFCERKNIPPKDDWYPLYKDLMPLVIAIPAAYLGYCFQRRHNYLQALRDLWKTLIPAVQRAIQYTHLDQPNTTEFSGVMRDLSTSIDSLRGVFKNIPTPGRRKRGLYPYEPIKDISKAIDWLQKTKWTENDRSRARRCIAHVWYKMHSAMLKEFDRDVPVLTVSQYVKGQPPSLVDKLLKGTLTDEELKSAKREDNKETK